MHYRAIRNLSGQQFGQVLVLGLAGKLNPKKQSHFWLCRCLFCSRLWFVNGDRLKSSRSTKCHCTRQELTGQQFGRLTVLRRIPKGPTTPRAGWECHCACGAIVFVSSSRIRRTKSCGCLIADASRIRNRRHGATVNYQKPPEWQAYQHAKSRCTNPNDNRYYCYGARGIEFRFKSYEEFMAAVGSKPSPELSLDRINNDGHYEPGNVRWATAKQQAHNKRPYGTATRRNQPCI